MSDPENPGWEQLLEAQSEYIANLQRMLHSACQNAVTLKPEQHLKEGDMSAVGDSSCTTTTGGSASVAGFPEPASGPGSAACGTGHSVHSRRASLGSPSSVGNFQPLSPVAGSCSATPMRSAQSHTDVHSPLQLTPQVPRISPAQPTSADAGAGSLAPTEPPRSPPGKEFRCFSGAVPLSSAASAKVEEVANEVLRLRLLKSQHDELRAQQGRAEAQLRRLSPHVLLQFRSYLERNLREPSLASQVQDAVVQLIECLFVVCRIEVQNWRTVDGMLNTVRKLLRDPHSFVNKVTTPNITEEEAKSLAPFLLTSTQYKRVREKEVNEAYDALQAWIAAYYQYAVISNQVTPTTQSLDKYEKMLQRLTGQADGAKGAISSARSANAPVVSGRRSVAAGGSVSSPLGGCRAGLPVTTQRVPASHTSPERSTSPHLRGGSGPRGARGGVHGPRASPVRSDISSGPVSGRMRLGGSPAPPRTANSRPRSPGLSRVQSEQVLPARSLGSTARKIESRSPSPGTGRASPAAPPPRTTRTRRPEVDRRGLSPSQSEGSLHSGHGVRRMVSAPTTGPSGRVATSNGRTSKQSATSPSIPLQAPAVLTAPRGNVGSAKVFTLSGGQKSQAREGGNDVTSGGPSAPGPSPLRPKSPDRAGGQCGFTRASIKEYGRCEVDDEDSEFEDSDGHGPSRRVLSKSQYEALVRAVEQVVASPPVTLPPPPAPVVHSRAFGGRRNSGLEHLG